MSKENYVVTEYDKMKKETYNCKGCIRRCITMEQYLSSPPVNMNDKVVDYNCLVVDDEIDTTLERPSCFTIELEEEECLTVE
jgi:hypothetical protein